MSRTRHPAPSLPAPEETPGLSRRERRAAARGGVPAKAAGPAAAVRRVPVPDRQRNFATRRRG